MAIQLRLLIIGVVGSLFACGGESAPTLENTAVKEETPDSQLTQEEYPERKAHTLLFIDKTTSSDKLKDTALFTEILETTDQNVLAFFNAPGSSFACYYIHTNTLASRPAFEHVFDIEKPDLEGVHGPRKSMQKKKYKKSKNDLQERVLKNIGAALTSENTTFTRRQTDIWGTLEIIERHFRNKRDGSELRILYLSDMVESMKGEGRKDYHRTPLENRAQAQEAAQQDVKWITTHLDVSPAVLSGVKLTIIPTADAMSGQENLTNIRYYWEALFRELGLDDEIDWF